nr:hypothetical protein [Nitrosomonas nitrosa]
MPDFQRLVIPFMIKFFAVYTFLAFHILTLLPQTAFGHTVGIKQERQLVWGVTFSTDDRYVVTTNQEGVLLVFDTSSCSIQSLIVPSPIHDNSWERHMLTGLAWRPGQQELATAMRDGTVRLWSIDQRSGDVHEKGIYAVTSSIKNGHSGLRTVAFSQDGSLLAAAGHGPEVYVWKTEKEGPPIHVLNGQAGTINMVAFGRDSSVLLSAGDDGMIRFYDLKQEMEVRTIKTQGPILNALVSPDLRYIAVTSLPNEEATLFDFETGGEVRRLPNAPGTFVWALAFSPDNRILATGLRGEKSQIRLFRLDQGRELWDTVIPSGDWTFSLAFSHSGKYLLAGVYADGPYLLDSETGAILGRYGAGTCSSNN